MLVRVRLRTPMRTRKADIVRTLNLGLVLLLVGYLTDECADAYTDRKLCVLGFLA